MECRASRVVYENAWMTVREDTVARDDGSVGPYGVVDKPDFALVIPRETGGVWMVEQYRYAIGRRAWELPQGSWSGDARGDAEALARAELAEETGISAGSVVRLGHLYGAYGFCSQGFDVFLATDLVAGQPRREPTESDMVHRFVRDAELAEMVRTAAVVDAATLAAWCLLAWHEATAG